MFTNSSFITNYISVKEINMDSLDLVIKIEVYFFYCYVYSERKFYRKEIQNGVFKK